MKVLCMDWESDGKVEEYDKNKHAARADRFYYWIDAEGKETLLVSMIDLWTMTILQRAMDFVPASWPNIIGIACRGYIDRMENQYNQSIDDELLKKIANALGLKIYE